jgi:hypothetical protein
MNWRWGRRPPSLLRRVWSTSRPVSSSWAQATPRWITLCNCDEHYGDCQRDWLSGEQPQQAVYLDAFYIDKTEVTNRSWYAPNHQSFSVSFRCARDMDITL